MTFLFHGAAPANTIAGTKYEYINLKLIIFYILYFLTTFVVLVVLTNM